MRLPPDQAQRFLHLYMGLIGWCMRRRDPKSAIRDVATFRSASMDDKIAARDRMLDDPGVIAEYVAENPNRLGPEDLAQVDAWRVFRRGDVIVLRDLKRHTIVVDWSNPPIVYGVLSLTQELVELFPLPLPVLAHAVLLPWRDAIVCDGLVRFSNVYLGRGLRRELADAYREAKARGLVTSLDGTAAGTGATERSKGSHRKGRPRTAEQRALTTRAKRAFVGRWCVVEMDGWDADELEAEAALIEIDRSGRGTLELGLVQGELDGRFSIEDERPIMELTWEGRGDGEPLCGRGRFELEGAAELHGRIFIHLGDEVELVARKMMKGRRRKR